MNETSKSNGHSLRAAPRVLVVEDETDVALLIAYNLEAEAMSWRASRAATRPS